MLLYVLKAAAACSEGDDSQVGPALQQSASLSTHKDTPPHVAVHHTVLQCATGAAKCALWQRQVMRRICRPCCAPVTARVMQAPTTATAASVQQQCRAQPAGQQDAQHQQQHAVLGYIIVQVNSVTAHINKLAVAPHARRRGLGAALLRVGGQPLLAQHREQPVVQAVHPLAACRQLFGSLHHQDSADKCSAPSIVRCKVCSSTAGKLTTGIGSVAS